MPSAVMDAAAAMATKQFNLGQNDSTSPQGLSPEIASDKTLEEITRSALHATGASGSALVLSDGEGMSCRSSSGELAPPIGTRLNTDAGFTAMCVRTAEVVRCDDTKNDPRVDGSSCAQLGIRSILAVPIFNGQSVAGVLEVLSNEPNKFTDRHATALQLLARLVETLVNYASRTSMNPDAELQNNETGKAIRNQAKSICLSCKHSNPQGSQFCNHCGVILFSFLDPQDTAAGRSQPEKSRADQGVNEICEIISGNAGPATWKEISQRLLAHQYSVAAQQKPQADALKEKESVGSTKDKAKTSEDTAAEHRTAEATGLKARLGAVVRRNLWL